MLEDIYYFDLVASFLRCMRGMLNFSGFFLVFCLCASKGVSTRKALDAP